MMVTPLSLPIRIVVLALLASVTSASAATYYVDDLKDGHVGSGTSADPYRDLQVAIHQVPTGSTIRIRAGTYVASPLTYTDPTCGNCNDNDFYLGAVTTRGFRVAHKSLHLVGAGETQTVLVTKAGYGLLFENAASRVFRGYGSAEGIGVL